MFYIILKCLLLYCTIPAYVSVIVCETLPIQQATACENISEFLILFTH